MMTIGYGKPKQEHYELLNIKLYSALALLWPHRILYSNGTANLPACHVLFHVTRWYVPLETRDEETGARYWYKQYRSDLLQMSIADLQRAAGLSKQQARDAIAALEELGLIRCALRNIQLPNGSTAFNVRFIDINVDKVVEYSSNNPIENAIDTEIAHELVGQEPEHTLCSTEHTLCSTEHTLCSTEHTLCSTEHTNTIETPIESLATDTNVSVGAIAEFIAQDDPASCAAFGAPNGNTQTDNPFVMVSSGKSQVELRACENSRDSETKGKRKKASNPAAPKEAKPRKPAAPREPSVEEARLIEELEALDPLMAAEAHKRIGSYNKAQPGAVVSLYMATGIRVPKAVWSDVERVADDGELDITKLVRCYKAWLGRGFNPNGLGWLTDWYVNGIPQPRKTNGVATVSTPYVPAPTMTTKVDPVKVQGQAEYEASIKAMLARKQATAGGGHATQGR